MRIILKPAGLVVVLLAMISLVSVALLKTAKPDGASGPPAPTPEQTPTALNLAKNSGMEAPGSGRLPEGWDQKWVGNGKVDIRLDENEGHPAPPSLLIDTLGMSGKAQIAQLIPIKPGEKLNVRASIKSQGVGTFSCAVQFYNKDAMPLRFEHAGFAKPGEGWTSVATSVVVPNESVSLGIVLFTSGTGRGWLDDVSVVKVP